jgi:hypothetical protein
VITGIVDRQHAYVALTDRGTEIWPTPNSSCQKLEQTT